MSLRWLLIIMCLAISLIPIGIIGGFEGFQTTTAFLGLIIVVTFFVSVFISYFITHPLERLTENIDEISKGNLDVKLEKSEIYEINKLTDSLNRVLTSLKLAITKVGVKKGEIFEETHPINNISDGPIEEIPEFSEITTPIQEEIVTKQPVEAPVSYSENQTIVVDNQMESMLFFNEQGRIIDCNEPMVKKLGYQKAEVLSLNLADIDYLGTMKDIQKNIENVKNQGSLEVKTILKTRDGSSLFVTETIQYIPEKHLFRCIVTEDFSYK